MRILLTATVQSHIAQFHKPLINMLKADGHQVDIAARDNLSEKNGLCIDNADNIYNIPFSRSPKSADNIKAYKELKKIIDKNNYDIIHCNTPMGGIVTRLAAKKARKRGAKVFYTAHGFHFYKGAPLVNWLVYYPIEKFFAHLTDMLITISDADYALATENFSCPVGRIHSVGFDTDRYHPFSEEEKKALRKEFGISDDAFVCICTGELNANKNQCFVIECVPEVLKRVPKFKLLLAGNGPKRDELASLIKELGVENHVTMLGYRTDLPRFIAMSDAAISVSIREGLGLNLIEAMACQKPAIASHNRGHDEFVVNEYNGFIFENNSKPDMINALTRLGTDKALLAQLSENALASVDIYTKENVVEELRRLYE